MFDVADKEYFADAEGVFFKSRYVEAIAAELAKSPAAHGGGTATDKHFFVGDKLRVSIGDAYACECAEDECVFVAPVDVSLVFAFETEVLVVVAVDGVVGGTETGDGRKEVACGLDRDVEVAEVLAGADDLVGVGVFVVGVEENVVVGLEKETYQVVGGGMDIFVVFVAFDDMGVGKVEGHELVLMAAAVGPCVAKGAAKEDALEGYFDGSVLVAGEDGVAEDVGGVEADECVRAVVLPGEAVGEGENKFGEVEGEVERVFESGKGGVEVALLGGECVFG